MDDIKSNVAKNITELRLLNNMTQVELGEKLNYSDKTISKWERGESCPDITALVEMADIFGVSLDYLVRNENIDEAIKENRRQETKYNRKAISLVSESVAWVIAVLAFIITSITTGDSPTRWLYFVYALPTALIIRLVFNTVWFNPRHNYLIISALIWAILAAVHITFLCFSIDVSLIYLLGVAGQIVVVIWSFIKKPKKRKIE